MAPSPLVYRRLAIALSLLTLAGPPAVASAAARPVLFVGNLGDGTVSLIDPHSFQVLGKLNVIPDGNTPQDPAQAAVYPALVRAKGTNYVQGIAVSPDGRTLYVSRGFLGDVAALDISSGRLLWRLQVSGVRADHLALSPDGKRLFVSALSSNEVQVADTYGRKLDPHNMGAVYSRIKPSESAERPAGEWQTLDITLVDRHVTVILNGIKIIDNQPVLGPTGGALWSDVTALVSRGESIWKNDHGPGIQG